MKNIAKYILSKMFSFTQGKRFYSFNNHLLIRALDGLEFGKGGDPLISGERHVLQKIKKYFVNPVIFDCGSNNGQYASMCIEELTTAANLHCFEPTRDSFQKISDYLGKHKNVTLNKVAVGDRKQKLKLYSYSDTSVHTAFLTEELSPNGVNMQEQEEVECITLDDYCIENKIDKINLLKMDIEGFEYNALLGSKRMAGMDKIDMIQFEIGKPNIEARIFFRDFYKLLYPRYKFYRILSWGLTALPEEYSELNELFFCANYLAVNRSFKGQLED